MSDYFTFNGTKSTEFGLTLVNNGLRKKNIAPSKKTITETIPGRDGRMEFDQTYDSRTITLQCLLKDTTPANIRKMMTWLGEKFSQELILSYEPYKVYKATYNSQITMNEYMNGGIFDIQFQCNNPFAQSMYSTLDIINNVSYDENFLYDSGLYYADDNSIQYEWTNITTPTDMTVYNASNVDGCAPNIIIDGSADDITILHFYDSWGMQVKDVVRYGSFDGTLEINSLLQNTFLDGSVDNDTFVGNYFELEKQGDNYFMFNGTNMNINSVKFDFKFLYI